MNEAYKNGLEAINQRIRGGFDEALALIINLVKDNGGLLKTPQCEDKPFLYAYYEDFDGHTSLESIHGLRWDEELGLCICTDSMLENYQYDTRYYFDYFYNFEGEDLEELNKVLADPAYFVEIDKYNLELEDTLLSLIGGLPAYL